MNNIITLNKIKNKELKMRVKLKELLDLTLIILKIFDNEILLAKGEITWM